MEFNIAADLLDTEDRLEPIDIEFIRQSFYNRLSNCQRYIQAALRQIP